MDIPSNNCIAWFCRSTRPFQTFLVSNIGLLWLGSTKHVCYTQLPRYSTPYPFQLQAQSSLGLGSRKVRTTLSGAMLSPAHAYLPRVQVKCGTLWRLVPQSTRSFLLISPHMHPRQFNYLPLYQTTPASNLVAFLVFSAERSSENPYHTREISTSRKVATCLLFIQPHLAHPSPYMGSSVGVLCTGY